MTESDFWAALEYRVSGELSELRDNRLRFSWCDGFVPDDFQPNDNCIVGYTYICEDSGRHYCEHYRFQLWLHPRAHGSDGIDWTPVIPDAPHSDWLWISRDDKRIDMRPYGPTRV